MKLSITTFDRPVTGLRNMLRTSQNFRSCCADSSTLGGPTKVKSARKLMAAMIALFVITNRPSFAEVELDLKDPAMPFLSVYGTISQSDADYVAQHEVPN